VLFGQDLIWRRVGDRRLNFVLHSCDDIGLSPQHRIEARLGHIVRVVLLLGTDLRVHHVRPTEELRLGRTRHRTDDGDAAVAQFLTESKGERIQERLAGVVDGLEAAGRETGNRAGDQDTSRIPPQHLIS
jgi:hypothetical protein